MSEQEQPRLKISHPGQASVCDVLARVLDRGVMVAGELTLSVADIDLVYLGFCIRLSGFSSMQVSMSAGDVMKDYP